MATRFDRVTTPLRVRDPELDDFDLEVRALARLVQEPPAPVPRSVPTRGLTLAMAVWLSMIFATCYVALPTVLAMTGLNGGLLTSAIFSFPAFALASIVSVVGAAVAKPEIRLDLAGSRDPVLSATVGGLGVWALIHNTNALLVPFNHMGTAELASFLALNVLEMSLLGMMFASFTRRKLVAMALGGGFQFLMLGLALTLIKLAMYLQI